MIQSTQRAKEDGKVDWKDIPNFMGVPVKMLTAFNGIEKIDDELIDLDATEIAELERRIDAYSKNPRYANLVGHHQGEQGQRELRAFLNILIEAKPLKCGLVFFLNLHSMNTIEQIDFKCIMVASTTDSTLSRLWMEKYSNQKSIAQQGLCWILEDGQRSAKIDGRTCIPVGRYRVRPTRNSKFYEQYQKDPSLKLKYVLTLEEVPDFSLIWVHPGVKIDETRGCPLPGLATDMDNNSNFVVGRGRDALKWIHRHLDVFFDEKGMDFRIPVWWDVVRVPLIEACKI